MVKNCNPLTPIDLNHTISLTVSLTLALVDQVCGMLSRYQVVVGVLITMSRARDAYSTNVAVPPTTFEVPDADSIMPGV